MGIVEYCNIKKLNLDEYVSSLKARLHSKNKEIKALKKKPINLIYIPENKYGIPENYYSNNVFVDFLRVNKKDPEIIQFLADMLEE